MAQSSALVLAAFEANRPQAAGKGREIEGADSGAARK